MHSGICTLDDDHVQRTTDGERSIIDALSFGRTELGEQAKSLYQVLASYHSELTPGASVTAIR